MNRPGQSKKPRIHNIQLEWKKNTVVLKSNGMEFVSWATAVVCFKMHNERHFQTNDSSLTKIIFLLVNIRKNKVSDLKFETSFTIYY
jgi:hypothetical protein